MRKPYCSGDCDFKSHFVSQAGRGFSSINVYRGVPYQARGGSFLSRFAVPIAKYFGKHLLKTAIGIGEDVLSNQNVKQSLKKRFKDTASTVAREGLKRAGDVLDQHGTGRKRKRISRKKTTSRKRRVTRKRSARRRVVRKRDIFT